MKSCLIRVSRDFKFLVNQIRGKELLINGKEISFEEVTRKITEYIDWEKIWQNEFNKK